MSQAVDVRGDTATGRLQAALSTLLRELIDGSAAEGCWVLNPKDPGLLRSLATLTAAAASRSPSSGAPSIAAHVDHLCYGLELMNRWSDGENPFENANYSASWQRLQVSDEEWAARLDRLRTAAHGWLSVLHRPRELSDMELTGMAASVAHLAYHMGAIRQIDRSTRGPAARD
jgi:hypothetical protein